MDLYEYAFDILKKESLEKKMAGRVMTSDNYCQYRGQALWDLLKHMNIFEDDLNALNIIHVAGTKGKGSTCTFIESILRKNGIKTGMFTSPHMIDLTERIVIDGKQISKEYFGQIFQRVWANEGRKICEDFHTASLYIVFFVIAIRAFIDCQVEVVIIEVGKGGEYDSTNIIPPPLVCAVTYLEIDHTTELGNTIESIAWHKSGIFKEGSTAFTWPQDSEAMEVLYARAEERNCSLFVVPDISAYTNDYSQKIHLGLSGRHQEMNASLAMQVCNFWFQKMEHGNPTTKVINGEAQGFNINKCYLQGLKAANILGRQQIIKRGNATFYLDVAHTKASIKAAAEWFGHSSKLEETKVKKKCSKILVLSITGNRDRKNILRELQDLKFDHVTVVPSLVYVGNEHNTFSCDYFPDSEIIEMARDTAMAWNDLGGSSNNSNKCCTFKNINNAVAWIAKGRDEELFQNAIKFMDFEQEDEGPSLGKHLQILVTGTFRIVRGFLCLLRN